MTRALLGDDTLALRSDPAVWAIVEPCLPLGAHREPDPARVRAWIDARPAPPAFDPPPGPRTLELSHVAGWVRPDGGVVLHGAEGAVSARIDPAGGTAELRLAPRAAALGPELFAAFLLSAALLLGRSGRTMVHGGAIVAPDGRGWLLAGGTFSGKTTTCVTLIRAGWDYVADDQVVLGRGDGGLRVEGWPRRFNLDHGYAAGASVGVRSRVDPAGFGPGRWCPTAPLAGVLFPRVEAASPTALAPVHPAWSLSRLLQQSPWLLADAAAARDVLSLLEAAARLPAYDLRLGNDSFCAPDRLIATLAGAVNVTECRLQPRNA